MHCDRCGKKASDEFNKTIGEGYIGDYFCSEECIDKLRTDDDQFR